MSRLKIDELTRLAFIYAERDQRALAEAYGHMPGDSAARRARSLAKQLRAYRLNRWGSTAEERLLGGMTAVSLDSIRERDAAKLDETLHRKLP
jgi:hypothetical protein